MRVDDAAVSELHDIYLRVQELKEQSFDMPADLIGVLSDRLAEQLGRRPSTGELEAAVAGIGWVARMLHDFKLDLADALAVPEAITANVLTNLRRARERNAPYGEREAVEAGIGAGFYTGLYMGLLLMRERS